jgi:hypothetical protein
MKMHRPNVRIDHQYFFLFSLYESGKLLLKKHYFTPQKLCGVYILDNGQATAYSNTIGHQTQQNWQ